MSKVFKITMSAVYNNDEITMDEITDNIFNAMQSINKNLAILNIDDIKEMKRPKKTIVNLISSLTEEPMDNVKNNEHYIEVKKEKSVKKRNKK